MDLAETLKLAVLAVAIEACIGYPQNLFHVIGHPVSWIGRLVALADQALNNKNRSFAARSARGSAALILLLLASATAAHLVGAGIAAVGLPPPMSITLGALIGSSLIAQRSLAAHVLAVAKGLEKGGPEGRKAVAKIVGRNVEPLDASGVACAAIESLAESYSDGVVAPAFFLAILGEARRSRQLLPCQAFGAVGHNCELIHERSFVQECMAHCAARCAPSSISQRRLARGSICGCARLADRRTAHLRRCQRPRCLGRNWQPRFHQ
jgi:adenosylcobinamide-phosphate synthase